MFRRTENNCYEVLKNRKILVDQVSISTITLNVVPFSTKRHGEAHPNCH